MSSGTCLLGRHCAVEGVIEMTFDLKVKIAVWGFVALMWGLSLLAMFGISALERDLEGVPTLLDEVKHEMEWMRL